MNQIFSFSEVLKFISFCGSYFELSFLENDNGYFGKFIKPSSSDCFILIQDLTNLFADFPVVNLGIATLLFK